MFSWQFADAVYDFKSLIDCLEAREDKKWGRSSSRGRFLVVEILGDFSLDIVRNFVLRQEGEIYRWAVLSVRSNKGYCKKFKLPSSSPLLIIGMRNSFFSFPNCFTIARVITPLKTWTNGYNIEPPEPLKRCLWWTNPSIAPTEKKTGERADWACSQTDRTVTCGINWIHLRSNVSVIKQICGPFDLICHTHMGVDILLLWKVTSIYFCRLLFIKEKFY